MKQFETIKINAPKRNVFDLSHERKMTMKMGYLTPIFLSEVLPGDKFNVQIELLMRTMPMLAPMMHRVNVYMHFFFVPYRLIWNDWEDFITKGFSGTQAPNLPMMYASLDDYNDIITESSLGDYLGCPTGVPASGQGDMIQVSQLPFRAYQLVYDQYFRDQNLSQELIIPKHSLTDEIANFSVLTTLRKRAWEKDYFTSCLPHAQRGNPVGLVFSGGLDVTGVAQMYSSGGPALNKDVYTDGSGRLSDSSGNQMTVHSGLHADASDLTIPVSDVRRSFAVQRWLEKSMRFGARYIEQIRGIFGVVSKDARLQRPEFLAGGKIPIQVSEVLQTSETATTPQGTMAGHGVAVGIPNGFKHYFTEHGLVLGLISVLPRTAYQQGLPKLFSKSDTFDFYTPDLAHIGEQPVLNKEVYLDDDDQSNNDTFGYQPRYSEYRYAFDSVHGAMRSSLDFWHMGRQFASRPLLNESFVMSNPTSRIFPVEDTSDKLIVQSYCKFTAVRPVAKFGDPI